jgi:cell division septum initiation protein DivIVA
MEVDQDNPNSNRTQSPKAYGVVGDEVASVLASARKASAEMRAQARQYADSLVDGARQEIAEIQARAEDNASAITSEATEEARLILQDARREVLRIVEAAQARVYEAEKAVKEAEIRRDSLLALETEIEAGVTAVTADIRARAAKLRQTREDSATTKTPNPTEDFERLLADSSAELEAHSYANGNRNGNGSHSH